MGIRSLCITHRRKRGNLVGNERSAGYGEVFARTGLTEGLTPVVELEVMALTVGPGHTLVQRVGKCLNNFRIDRLMAVGGRHLQVVAVTVGDLGDSDRVALHTVCGIHGEDAGHGQRRNIH